MTPVNSHRLHLLLKTKTSTQTPLPPPRHPLLLRFPLMKLVSEWTTLFLDSPTAGALRLRGGGRGEEAGSDRNITGERPPSRSTCTNCLCPATRGRLKLRVTNKCKRMQNSVSLRQAGWSRQRPRCLGRVPHCTRQPWTLNAQKKLQAGGVTMEGEGLLTGGTRTQPPGATSGTGGLQEAGEGPTTCTTEVGGPAGVTSGASSTMWWRERGRGRRFYDKGQQEGQ